MEVVEFHRCTRSEFFGDAKAVLDILHAVQKRVHMPCLKVGAVVVVTTFLALALGDLAQRQLRALAAYVH